MDLVQASPRRSMTAHQEHLQKFEGFCAGLFRTMLQCGLSAEQAGGVFCANITAECVQCGMEISGVELLALAQAATEPEHPKLKRLRLGDCARKGCNSYYYRFRFEPCSSLDWPILLPRIEQELQAPQKRPGDSAVATPARGFWIPSFPRRGWVALGLILLILFVRHWHRGGRIPFVREPENFRVDVVTESGRLPAER